MDPAPFSVQSIFPFVAEATPSGTVADPFTQIVWLPLAFAVGPAEIARFLVEVILSAQGEMGVAVRVSSTLPDDISAALGVYVHVVKEFSLAKLPFPLDVQFIVA
jgi:hypothetical protein